MAPKVERKRQARGEAQVKRLLEAAEVVFARDGYHDATTNEISATAEVSPATFYQFFENKEAIANALALDYAHKMGAINDATTLDDLTKLSLFKFVSTVVDPLLDFHTSHPGFQALLLQAPLSDETKAVKHALTANLVAKLSLLFRAKNSALKKKDADWAADMVMLLFKGFLPEIRAASGERRQKMIKTLKSILGDYLAPIFEVG